jgi:hypothetical protein
MILTLRRYLLVLLGLLQFVAPLVHAHSGNNFAQFGLHLPNLEIYSTVHNQSEPVFQSVDDLLALDNAIVSISTGIQNQQNDVDDLSPLLYFPPHPFFISRALSSCEINFSPHQLESSKTFVHSPQSPRAPPV